MKRAFIIYSPTAWSTTRLNPRSLPSYGRVDVLLRSALAAFKYRGGFREDVEAVTVHDGPPEPPLTLHFTWEFFNTNRPDTEVKVAEAIAEGRLKGVRVLKAGLIRVLREFKERKFALIYLREGGECLDNVVKRCLGGFEGIAFVLGAHVDIPAPLEGRIVEKSFAVASVGPMSYLSSQTITYANYIVDRVYMFSTRKSRASYRRR